MKKAGIPAPSDHSIPLCKRIMRKGLQQGPLRDVRGCDGAATSQKTIKLQIIGSWERISRGILSQFLYPGPGDLLHELVVSVLQLGPRGFTAALAHLEQKAWKTWGKPQKSPSVLYINMCSEKKKSSEDSLIPLNIEKQQRGKGALTSSASVSHTKNVLLKSGKLALFQKKKKKNP